MKYFLFILIFYQAGATEVLYLSPITFRSVRESSNHNSDLLSTRQTKSFIGSSSHSNPFPSPSHYYAGFQHTGSPVTKNARVTGTDDLKSSFSSLFSTKLSPERKNKFEFIPFWQTPNRNPSAPYAASQQFSSQPQASQFQPQNSWKSINQQSSIPNSYAYQTFKKTNTYVERPERPEADTNSYEELNQYQIDHNHYESATQHPFADNTDFEELARPIADNNNYEKQTHHRIADNNNYEKQTYHRIADNNNYEKLTHHSIVDDNNYEKQINHPISDTNYKLMTHPIVDNNNYKKQAHRLIADNKNYEKQTHHPIAENYNYEELTDHPNSDGNNHILEEVKVPVNSQELDQINSPSIPQSNHLVLDKTKTKSALDIFKENVAKIKTQVRIPRNTTLSEILARGRNKYSNDMLMKEEMSKGEYGLQNNLNRNEVREKFIRQIAPKGFDRNAYPNSKEDNVFDNSDLTASVTNNDFVYAVNSDIQRNSPKERYSSDFDRISDSEISEKSPILPFVALMARLPSTETASSKFAREAKHDFLKEDKKEELPTDLLSGQHSTLVAHHLQKDSLKLSKTPFNEPLFRERVSFSFKRKYDPASYPSATRQAIESNTSTNGKLGIRITESHKITMSNNNNNSIEAAKTKDPVISKENDYKLALEVLDQILKSGINEDLKHEDSNRVPVRDPSSKIGGPIHSIPYSRVRNHTRVGPRYNYKDYFTSSNVYRANRDTEDSTTSNSQIHNFEQTKPKMNFSLQSKSTENDQSIGIVNVQSRDKNSDQSTAFKNGLKTTKKEEQSMITDKLESKIKTKKIEKTITSTTVAAPLITERSLSDYSLEDALEPDTFAEYNSTEINDAWEEFVNEFENFEDYENENSDKTKKRNNSLLLKNESFEPALKVTGKSLNEVNDISLQANIIKDPKAHQKKENRSNITDQQIKMEHLLTNLKINKSDLDDQLSKLQVSQLSKDSSHLVLQDTHLSQQANFSSSKTSPLKIEEPLSQNETSQIFPEEERQFRNEPFLDEDFQDYSLEQVMLGENSSISGEAPDQSASQENLTNKDYEHWEDFQSFYDATNISGDNEANKIVNIGKFDDPNVFENLSSIYLESKHNLTEENDTFLKENFETESQDKKEPSLLNKAENYVYLISNSSTSSAEFEGSFSSKQQLEEHEKINQIRAAAISKTNSDEMIPLPEASMLLSSESFDEQDSHFDRLEKAVNEDLLTLENDKNLSSEEKMKALTKIAKSKLLSDLYIRRTNLQIASQSKIKNIPTQNEKITNEVTTNKNIEIDEETADSTKSTSTSLPLDLRREKYVERINKLREASKLRIEQELNLNQKSYLQNQKEKTSDTLDPQSTEDSKPDHKQIQYKVLGRDPYVNKPASIADRIEIYRRKNGLNRTTLSPTNNTNNKLDKPVEEMTKYEGDQQFVLQTLRSTTEPPQDLPLSKRLSNLQINVSTTPKSLNFEPVIESSIHNGNAEPFTEHSTMPSISENGIYTEVNPIQLHIQDMSSMNLPIETNDKHILSTRTSISAEPSINNPQMQTLDETNSTFHNSLSTPVEEIIRATSIATANKSSSLLSLNNLFDKFRGMTAQPELSVVNIFSNLRLENEDNSKSVIENLETNMLKNEDLQKEFMEFLLSRGKPADLLMQNSDVSLPEFLEYSNNKNSNESIVDDNKPITSVNKKRRKREVRHSEDTELSDFEVDPDSLNDDTQPIENHDLIFSGTVTKPDVSSSLNVSQVNNEVTKSVAKEADKNETKDTVTISPKPKAKFVRPPPPNITATTIETRVTSSTSTTITKQPINLPIEKKLDVVETKGDNKTKTNISLAESVAKKLNLTFKSTEKTEKVVNDENKYINIGSPLNISTISTLGSTPNVTYTLKSLLLKKTGINRKKNEGYNLENATVTTKNVSNEVVRDRIRLLRLVKEHKSFLKGSHDVDLSYLQKTLPVTLSQILNGEVKVGEDIKKDNKETKTKIQAQGNSYDSEESEEESNAQLQNTKLFAKIYDHCLTRTSESIHPGIVNKTVLDYLCSQLNLDNDYDEDEDEEKYHESSYNNRNPQWPPKTDHRDDESSNHRGRDYLSSSSESDFVRPKNVFSKASFYQEPKSPVRVTSNRGRNVFETENDDHEIVYQDRHNLDEEDDYQWKDNKRDTPVHNKRRFLNKEVFTTGNFGKKNFEDENEEKHSKHSQYPPSRISEEDDDEGLASEEHVRNSNSRRPSLNYGQRQSSDNFDHLRFSPSTLPETTFRNHNDYERLTDDPIRFPEKNKNIPVRPAPIRQSTIFSKKEYDQGTNFPKSSTFRDDGEIPKYVPQSKLKNNFPNNDEEIYHRIPPVKGNLGLLDDNSDFRRASSEVNNRNKNKDDDNNKSKINPTSRDLRRLQVNDANNKRVTSTDDSREKRGGNNWSTSQGEDQLPYSNEEDSRELLETYQSSSSSEESRRFTDQNKRQISSLQDQRSHFNDKQTRKNYRTGDSRDNRPKEGESTLTRSDTKSNFKDDNFGRIYSTDGSSQLRSQRPTFNDNENRNHFPIEGSRESFGNNNDERDYRPGVNDNKFKSIHPDQGSRESFVNHNDERDPRTTSRGLRPAVNDNKFINNSPLQESGESFRKHSNAKDQRTDERNQRPAENSNKFRNNSPFEDSRDSFDNDSHEREYIPVLNDNKPRFNSPRLDSRKSIGKQIQGRDQRASIKNNKSRNSSPIENLREIIGRNDNDRPTPSIIRGQRQLSKNSNNISPTGNPNTYSEDDHITLSLAKAPILILTDLDQKLSSPAKDLKFRLANMKDTSLFSNHYSSHDNENIEVDDSEEFDASNLNNFAPAKVAKYNSKQDFSRNKFIRVEHEEPIPQTTRIEHVNTQNKEELKSNRGTEYKIVDPNNGENEEPKIIISDERIKLLLSKIKDKSITLNDRQKQIVTDYLAKKRREAAERSTLPQNSVDTNDENEDSINQKPRLNLSFKNINERNNKGNGENEHQNIGKSFDQEHFPHSSRIQSSLVHHLPNSESNIMPLNSDSQFNSHSQNTNFKIIKTENNVPPHKEVSNNGNIKSFVNTRSNIGIKRPTFDTRSEDTNNLIRPNSPDQENIVYPTDAERENHLETQQSTLNENSSEQLSNFPSKSQTNHQKINLNDEARSIWFQPTGSLINANKHDLQSLGGNGRHFTMGNVQNNVPPKFPTFPFNKNDKGTKTFIIPLMNLNANNKGSLGLTSTFNEKKNSRTPLVKKDDLTPKFSWNNQPKFFNGKDLRQDAEFSSYSTISNEEEARPKHQFIESETGAISVQSSPIQSHPIQSNVRFHNFATNT